MVLVRGATGATETEDVGADHLVTDADGDMIQSGVKLPLMMFDSSNTPLHYPAVSESK
ncbi:MAG: hypothetical protein GX192_02900, partial [Clostridiales bacterium]|nr:hypothetical protein [Clostridiales bacterium]